MTTSACSAKGRRCGCDRRERAPDYRRQSRASAFLPVRGSEGRGRRHRGRIALHDSPWSAMGGRVIDALARRGADVPVRRLPRHRCRGRSRLYLLAHRSMRPGITVPTTRSYRGPKQDSASVAARFWSKVDKDGAIPSDRPDLGPCWEWTGARAGTGYGSIRQYNRARPAHIVSWEYANGSVPEGRELDHLCRVRHCVNPSHLEPVTRLTNVRRGRGHGSETHCPKGHSYDDAYTYTTASGVIRQCRTCRRERSRDYYWSTGRFNRYRRAA